MKQPIFEHGDFDERMWAIQWQFIPTPTLVSDLQHTVALMFANIELGDAGNAAFRAKTLYRVTRELERRELASPRYRCSTCETAYPDLDKARACHAGGIRETTNEPRRP